MQPWMVWDPEVDEDGEAPVALWSGAVLGLEDPGLDWVEGV